MLKLKKDLKLTHATGHDRPEHRTHPKSKNWIYQQKFCTGIVEISTPSIAHILLPPTHAHTRTCV